MFETDSRGLSPKALEGTPWGTRPRQRGNTSYATDGTPGPSS